MADHPSCQVRWWECWSLHHLVHKRIFQVWHGPLVNLFTTHLNKKLSIYMSLPPNLISWKEDVFQNHGIILMCMLFLHMPWSVEFLTESWRTFVFWWVHAGVSRSDFSVFCPCLWSSRGNSLTCGTCLCNLLYGSSTTASAAWTFRLLSL